MATSDLTRAGRRHGRSRFGQSFGALRLGWVRFWRFVSRYMPKRLYARSLIIVIAPMILLAVGDRLHVHGEALADGDASPVRGGDARYRGHHRHD